MHVDQRRLETIPLYNETCQQFLSEGVPPQVHLVFEPLPSSKIGGSTVDDVSRGITSANIPTEVSRQRAPPIKRPVEMSDTPTSILATLPALQPALRSASAAWACKEDGAEVLWTAKSDGDNEGDDAGDDDRSVDSSSCSLPAMRCGGDFSDSAPSMPHPSGLRGAPSDCSPATPMRAADPLQSSCDHLQHQNPQNTGNMPKLTPTTGRSSLGCGGGPPRHDNRPSNVVTCYQTAALCPSPHTVGKAGQSMSNLGAPISGSEAALVAMWPQCHDLQNPAALEAPEASCTSCTPTAAAVHLNEVTKKPLEAQRPALLAQSSPTGPHMRVACGGALVIPHVQGSGNRPPTGTAIEPTASHASALQAAPSDCSRAPTEDSDTCDLVFDDADSSDMQPPPPRSDKANLDLKTCPRDMAPHAVGLSQDGSPLQAVHVPGSTPRMTSSTNGAPRCHSQR
jgi:hypothetical protein